MVIANSSQKFNLLLLWNITIIEVGMFMVPHVILAKRSMSAPGFVFFKDLIERGVAPIYLRLLLFIYKEQDVT